MPFGHGDARHGPAYRPRIFRSHRAMFFRPEPMPGLPIPLYLENVL